MRPLRAIVPLTSLSVAVAATPIMAARSLASEESLLFAFLNDGASVVDVTIETTERTGGPYDGSDVITLTVAAGEQRVHAVALNLRQFYRVTGVATGAPSTVVWTLRGVPRQ